jgi:hypothetical protein
MNTLIAQMSIPTFIFLVCLFFVLKVAFCIFLAVKVWNWLFPSWPAGTTGPIGAKLDARDEERALEAAIAEVEAMDLTHEELQEALLGPRFLDAETGKLPDNVIPLVPR